MEVTFFLVVGGSVVVVTEVGGSVQDLVTSDGMVVCGGLTAATLTSSCSYALAVVSNVVLGVERAGWNKSPALPETT